MLMWDEDENEEIEDEDNILRVKFDEDKSEGCETKINNRTWNEDLVFYWGCASVLRGVSWGLVSLLKLYK